MKKTLTAFIRMISKIIGRKNLEKLLIFSAKLINVNLQEHALLQIGAGTGVYLESGSELFFIKNILAKQFENNVSRPFFDVGANIGNYTLALRENITNAGIYAFEPVNFTE